MHNQRMSKQYRDHIQHHESGYIQQNPSEFKVQRRQVPLSANKNKQQINFNMQQDIMLQQKYNNAGSQMTPVGNQQGINSAYQQNALFLSQISNKDRANPSSGPQQSVFGPMTNLVSVSQGERNNPKSLMVNAAPFQQMTLKASSKLQLHENSQNQIATEMKNDQQHQMAQVMKMKRVNQSSNSQQFIYSQSPGQQHQKQFQIDNRDQRNQQRNSSSNDYKNYRQRMIQSEKKPADFSSAGIPAGVKLDNNRVSYQQQQQTIKIPQYYNNLKIQGFQNQAIASNQGVLTPQKQQIVPILAQIGPKGQISLIQPQNYSQKLQQHQLIQQLQKQQQMQLMLQNSQIPNSQKEQRHPNHIFQNHMIQSKAAGSEPQSQQQMRNSQKLVEAAEQIFIQKQMQAQLMQNNSGLNNGQQLQSAKQRQSQKNQAQEFKQLQAYQQAFTNVVTHTNQNDVQISEDQVKSNQQATPMRSLNGREQQSESRSKTNNDKDYSEFQEYLIQQQEKQQTECSALQYAHSKKQRELLKAKEFSQNVQNDSQMLAQNINNQLILQDQQNEPLVKNQENQEHETTPRDLLGSKKSQRQSNQLFSPEQSQPHARSQSGNRERHIENMTIASQPNSELTHQQLLQLQPPQMKQNDVSRSTTNPLNDNWGSNKGQSQSTATTSGPQGPSAPRAGSIESKASKNSDAIDSDIEKVDDQQLSKVSEESFIEDGGCDECHSNVEDQEENEPDYGDEEDDNDQEKKPPPSKPKNNFKSKKPNEVQEEEVKAEKKPSVPRAPWRVKKEQKEIEKAEQEKKDQKKKKVNKILGSMPSNWEEEEAKFFESNFEYDPQFTYESPATNKKFLKMFPAPKYDYMPQAKKIIDKFLEVYGSESNYFESEGRVLEDKEEVEKIIWDYIDEHGPEVRAVGRINFSTKNVASTSVTYDNWTNKIRINVQLPIQYREGRIRGVLHHEIGSHYLRRFNEVQQPWHNERKKYGIKSSITIEEGSGCINMFLEQSKDPNKWCFLFKPALNYYMCCKASELSFKELFNDLEKYVDNPRQRYKYVLRVKRGLTDTSQPGGLYKDQVYLEGALKLLENRHDVDWHGFYSAKLNIEDLKRPRLMKKLKKDNIVLPKFVIDQEEYKKRLDVIARHNFID